MLTVRLYRPTLAACARSALASLLLCGCSAPPTVTKPVGVPFDLPTNLRQCASQYGLTDPTTFKVSGDLMLGYGTERNSHVGVSDCLEELVRLIDVHNQKMKALSDGK
jgi:hypothetical protein